MVLSTIPPVTPVLGFGLTAFLATFTPSTMTCSPSTRLLTTPRLPLSLPARTTTSSFLRILSIATPLQNFWCQGHDLHELLGAQLARHRPEDAGTDRLQLGVQQDSSIAVELDQGTVLAAHTFGGTHDNSVVNFTLFDAATWGCDFDGDLDHVANACITALGAAQYLDAQNFFGTGIVGHFQPAFGLNHDIFFPNLSRRNPTENRRPAVSLGPAALPLLEQNVWVIGLSNVLHCRPQRSRGQTAATHERSPLVSQIPAGHARQILTLYSTCATCTTRVRVQAFVFEIGRPSEISTVSPVLAWLVSSCA